THTRSLHRRRPLFPTRRSSDLGAIAPRCCPWPVSQRKTSPSLPNCKPKREPAGSEPRTPAGSLFGLQFGKEGEVFLCETGQGQRSEQHTSELQSPDHFVCHLMP